MNSLRNIVILKDLPSNVIEEAFIVLKNNQKVKKLERVDNGANNFIGEKSVEEDDNFIIKEAELLISNYIKEKDKTENIEEFNNSRLMKKYKRLKKLTVLISMFLTIAIGFAIIK